MQKLSKSQVLFVYLGDRIPDYAVSSIEMAAKFSNQDIVLLANENALKKSRIENCLSIPVENFYSPAKFDVAQRGLESDAKFRGSLWAKSLERFFVLEQYMIHRGVDEIFHAELDQFLFDTGSLVDALKGLSYQGIFAPCHNSKAVVASLFFCNSLEALTDFLRFAASGVSYSSEMELLSQWASKSQSKFLELPTVHTFYHLITDATIPGSDLLSCKEVNGVTDAAEFGQWFGGIDPRNVPIMKVPTNKFVGPISNSNLTLDELSSCKLHLDALSNKLMMKIPNRSVTQIYNLHIHSKIHSRKFLDETYLENVISSVNSEKIMRFAGTRRKQINDFIFSYTLIILKRVKRILANILKN
jgi:hypothetical protein